MRFTLLKEDTATRNYLIIEMVDGMVQWNCFVIDIPQVPKNMGVIDLFSRCQLQIKIHRIILFI
jgi:hypothetical protein